MKQFRALSLILALGLGITACQPSTKQAETSISTPSQVVSNPSDAPQTKGQETKWALPFSEEGVDNPESAAAEIAAVKSAFEEAKESAQINQKKPELPEGGLGFVYYRDGNLIATDLPDDDAGMNGSRMVYFDASGRPRMTTVFAHGSSWFNAEFVLLGADGLYRFVQSEEIEYDEDGIGHYAGEDLPLDQQIEFDEFLEEDLDHYLAASEAAFEEAKYLEADRQGRQYFAGQISWEYDFIMQWQVDENGKLKGKYRYKSSNSDLKLEGTVTEERFAIDEIDPGTGKLSGRWQGQFTYDNKAEGWWKAPGKEPKYFEFESAPGYEFSGE